MINMLHFSPGSHLPVTLWQRAIRALEHGACVRVFEPSILRASALPVVSVCLQCAAREVLACGQSHFLVCSWPEGVEDGAEQAEQRRGDDGRKHAVRCLGTLAVEADAVDPAREGQLTCFEGDCAELLLRPLVVSSAIMSCACRPAMPVPCS